MDAKTKNLLERGDHKVAALNIYTTHTMPLDDLLYAYALVSAEIGARLPDETSDKYIDLIAGTVDVIKNTSPETSKLMDIILENSVAHQQHINSSFKENLAQLEKGFLFSDKDNGTVIPEKVDRKNNELHVTLTNPKTGARVSAIWDLEDVLLGFEIGSYYFLEIADDGRIIHHNT